MLYICILSNKFDLNQALRVSHNNYVFGKIHSCKTGDGNLLFQWYSTVEALSAHNTRIANFANVASFTGKKLLILSVSCYELMWPVWTTIFPTGSLGSLWL